MLAIEYFERGIGLLFHSECPAPASPKKFVRRHRIKSHVGRERLFGHQGGLHAWQSRLMPIGRLKEREKRWQQ
jgi:hypothetical protein